MRQNQNYRQCYVCGQGELLVVQDLETKIYSIMCDDCECQWSNTDALDIDRRLPETTGSVRDATPEEIKKLGWTQFLNGDVQ